jgi:hypothetical protein
MKFIIEEQDQEGLILLHFDEPVESLLPRLCTIEKTTQQIGPMMMAVHKFCQPHKDLIGVESLRPVSRYTLELQVGKCFIISEVIINIVDKLEIETSEESWENWISKLENSIQPNQTLQDTVAKELADKFDILHKF